MHSHGTGLWPKYTHTSQARRSRRLHRRGIVWHHLRDHQVDYEAQEEQEGSSGEEASLLEHASSFPGCIRLYMCWSVLQIGYLNVVLMFLLAYNYAMFAKSGVM